MIDDAEDTPPSGQDHPPAETIAAYLDGTLSRAERDDVERHLAECQDCRAEVSRAAQILEQRRPSTSRRTIGVAAALAVAALAGVLLTRGAATNPERLRSGPDTTAIADSMQLDANATVTVRTVPEEPVRVLLAWTSLDPGSSYRISLTNQRGTLLWNLDTADTSAAVPDSVVLDVGERYFWVVDGVQIDGRSATTGIRELTVR